MPQKRKRNICPQCHHVSESLALILWQRCVDCEDQWRKRNVFKHRASPGMRRNWTRNLLFRQLKGLALK